MRRSRAHRRRSRRAALRARQVRFLAGFSVVVLGLIAAALAGDYVERERQRAILAEAGLRQPESLPDPDDPLPATDSRERPVFPFSIVDGGVRSPGELKEAMDRDPVVAKHFANFDLSRTRVQTLQAPKVAHVSYRVGDDVFWTRKAVVIPAGETVLTDGRNFCRTRCANQLASTPGPVSPLEPPASLLDTPLPPRPRIFPTGALPPASGRAGGGSNSSAAGYDGGAGVGGGRGARLSSGRPLSVGDGRHRRPEW